MVGRHQADPSGQDPDRCLAGGGAMGALMRSTDWSRSPLGPVAEWPQSLKTAVSICLGSRFPILIWWGPEFINLYNDACRPMLGDKHPRALGQKGQECWTEIWHIIGPMLEGVRARGEATSSDDQMLPLHRHGFTEECRFTFTYSPIRDESGDVGGVFCAVIETTERVLAARRQARLREPAAKAASARESIDACDAAASWLDEDIGATQMLPAGPGAGGGRERILHLEQQRLLELIASGAPIGTCLAALCAAVPRLSPDARARVLPAEAANEEIDHLADAGPAARSGSSGEAAGAHSTPMTGADGRAIGSFALELAEARPPTEWERRIGAWGARLAGIAIERHRTERALRESEERYRAIVESQTEMVCRFRPDGTILFVNEGYARARATTSDALRGVNFWDFIDEQDRAEVRALLDRLRPEDPLVRIENRFETAEGVRWTLWTNHGLSFDADGRAMEVQSSGIDITARKAAEEALRESEERYRQLVGLLPVAVYSCDAPSGVITFYNEHAATLWGRRPAPGSTDERFCGSFRLRWPDGSLLPHDQTPMAVALCEGREFRNMDVIIERPDGTRINVLVNIDPIRDAQGRVVAAVNAFHDITARKRAEETLRLRTAQYETLLNRAPLGVYLVDADFRIRDVNPTALPVFGDIPELIGRDFDEVIHVLWEKEYADELVRIFRHTLDTGESYQTPEHIEHRLDRGVTEYYEWRLDRIPLPDGRDGLVCYFRDISAQVLAREAIAASEERFRTLVSLTTDVPWTADAQGAFDRHQPKWAEFTGQTWDELRGFGWASALHPDDRGRILEAWDKARATCSLYEVQGRLWHAPSGQYRHFVARATPLRDADGRVREWVGACTDVHERKLAEEELRESEAQLRRSSRMKDEFLATLSHELRTPLNAVLGWTRMLRTGQLRSEVAQRALESVERNAKAQTELVDDLLDMSRISSGKLQIKDEAVDLRTVIGGAVETVRPAAAAKRVSLAVSVDPGVPAQVRGDVDRLRQIVWNLLTNAIKFTPAGGRVEVVLGRSGADAEIVVRDNGEGIDRDFLPFVFERFRQADGTTTRRHGGLGLGLAIVRHLAEAHGGTVEAASDGAGTGAAFTVRLPLATPASRTSVRPARPRQPRAALPDTRVLVVDDEADARDLLRVILELQGADVTIVKSAGEALHALQHGAFDVLLADIGMPDQDGYSLMRAVRGSDGRHAGLPAIAVTAYASPRERKRALDAGYTHHLAKPVDPKQLVAAVAQAVGKHAGAPKRPRATAPSRSARRPRPKPVRSP